MDDVISSPSQMSGAVASALVRGALFVKDLERSTRFYRALGLTSVYYEGVLEHPSAAECIGAPLGTRIHARILKQPGWPNYGMVGLFQLANPVAEGLPAPLGPPRTGEATLVFYVTSMDETLSALRREGATWSPQPVEFRLENISQREVCLRDPDGIFVNLIEADPQRARRLAPDVASAQAAAPPSATFQRAVAGLTSGRVSYLDAEGVEFGRESFEFVRHGGGSLVRALCEMDDIGLIRDVTLSLDKNGRPVDAFCRTLKDGRTLGSTWFLAEAAGLQFEGQLLEQGRLSIRVPTDGPLAYLGLHPLVCDGLVTGPRGVEAPGESRRVHGMTNSISPNGDEGLFATPVSIDVAFLGFEEVTTPAGRFPSLHYALRWKAEWPPADVWVRANDSLFLKMVWSLLPNTYVLTELTERET